MSLVLPDGTVTFLFTDVEGSTGIWEDDPVGMRRARALARHDWLSGIERPYGDGHASEHIVRAIRHLVTS